MQRIATFLLTALARKVWANLTPAHRTKQTMNRLVIGVFALLALTGIGSAAQD
jgi:hypothetical protein